MPGNKFRVYVAAFIRDGITKNCSLEPEYGLAMFYWGIWIEPKKGNGQGQLYHVEVRETLNSIDGPIPGGWT